MKDREMPEPTDIEIIEKFTIEGFGKSAKGHNVCAGRSVKTGKPMKAKTLTVWVVKETVINGSVVDILTGKP